MGKRCGMGVVVLFGLSALVVAARAGEEEIAVNKLPAAVKKAIKAKFPKAEIEEAAREVEDGSTTYEVKLEVKGRSVDVALKGDGTILEIEKEVPFGDLPKAVKKALAAKYPKAKLEKVEEVTKGKGGPVRYEIAIQTEVVLTAKGKVIQAEEEEDEKPSAKTKKSKDKDEEDDEDEDEDHGDVKAKKGEKHEHHAKASAKSKKDKDEDEDDGEVKAKKGDKD
jgi:hypothetical protein